MRRAWLSVALWCFLPLVTRAQEPFTLAILPDVQQESADGRLAQRLKWIVEHRNEYNIPMVLQCGDMMNFNLEAQYQHQSEAMAVLDQAHLPYATCIGNHDSAAVRPDSGSAAPGNVNANLRNTSLYNKYFPTNRFQNLAGTFEPGKIDNAYHTFEAGGLKWVVVNLELWARPEAVAWAKGVVADHPDANIIFLTHAHLNADSTIQTNNGGYGNKSPQYVFEQAMRPYANVRLVFSGHVGKHGYRTDTGDHGNTIYQFLQTYHDNQTNPVRLLTIDPKAGTMKTWVYCPSIGKDKEDGSAQVIEGVKWMQPASSEPAVKAAALAPAGGR
jgi:hypothetical protein